MKSIKKALALLSLTLILGFSCPVFAQQADNPSTTTARDTDDDDDTGIWGLAGLVGLLGLLGLKRRDDDVDRTRVTTNRARSQNV